MCGIYVTNVKFDKNTVLDKIETIKFRGPNNTGYWSDRTVSMAHLRLSILDLDLRANQPMQYENLHIVYNGEIYNYQSIRNELIELGHSFKTNSDTEVLLIAYSVWGRQVLNKINGMFSFIIYDSINEKLFGARDRLGVKPFFYYWENGDFEICSQLRPLIKKNSKICEDALSSYYDFGYIPSPGTIICGIKKLLPATYLEIDLKKKSINTYKYWDLNRLTPKRIPYTKAKDELHALLKDAIKIRLISDVPIGSFLSGGIDSALVSSIAASFKQSIKTFTIGFNDKQYDESTIATQFANIINSDHHVETCTPENVLEMMPKLLEVYDEPFADSSALPSLLLNYVAQKHVTVALSGDGGDENFLGYINFDRIYRFKFISILPYFVRSILSKIPWENIIPNKALTIKTFLSAKDSNEFALKLFTGYDSLQLKETKWWLKYYNDFRASSNNYLQRAADLNIKLWLENDSNVKVDRASMAFSIEVRSPFLDYRIIEFARQLPTSYRYYKGRKKRIVKDILKEYIPQDVFEQPKRGFSIPLGKWISTDLKADIEVELNDNFLNQLPNLNKNKFREQMRLHFNGTKDYSMNIWKIYVLSKWCKEFDFYQ